MPTMQAILIHTAALVGRGVLGGGRVDPAMFKAAELSGSSDAGVPLDSGVSEVCAHNALAKLGKGDAAQGAVLNAAIDAWQAGLTALGAGPVPGLTGVPDPEKWRTQVQLGWPGTDTVFEAAMQTVELRQLANRWCKGGKIGWAGSTPNPVLQLNVKKRERNAAELLG